MKKKSSRRAVKAKAPKRRRKAKAKAAPKRRKRRAAKGKAKAAPKRRRRRAAKAKTAPKRRRRRAAKGKAKAAPKRRRRRATKAKAAPKRRRRRVAKKSVRKSAHAMGMTKRARKNPGSILGFMKQEVSDFMTLAPSIAVQLGTMAAVGFASSKMSEQIKKMIRGVEADGKTAKPEPKEPSFTYKYAGALSSGVITLAAFAAMKMMKSEKSKEFTLPVLFGGMASTLVQVLAAVKVKPAKVEGVDPATQAEISLGQHLGLPIGEFVAMGEFVSVGGYLDVHGRQIAINGMGDYVDQPLGELDIHQGRYQEGTVVSMGDYVDQPLGELTLHQGRYQEGTVLGGVHSQMSEGRQGARALGARGDDRVESFINSGSLSGSVFD
jgi:hypothetical protein